MNSRKAGVSWLLLLVGLWLAVPVMGQDIMVTSFEEYTLGTIHNQGDWSLETGWAQVVDEAAEVHTGSQSLQFVADNQSLVVHNVTFDGDEQGVSGIVYVDMFVKINSMAIKDFAISGYDLFGNSEKRTFVVEFDTPEGTGGTAQMFNGGSRLYVGNYEFGTWNRISARVDYNNAGYQVIFNGRDAVSGSFRETYTPTASGNRPAGVKEFHALRFNLGYDNAVGFVEAAMDDIYISTTPIPDVEFPVLVITHEIDVEDPNIGSISVSPDLDEYPDSSEVTATLNVPDGYMNGGWTGDLSGTELVKTFQITQDMDISANVVIDPENPPAQYSVVVTQPDFGTITLDPYYGGIYYAHTEVTATLDLPPSYMNAGWTGDLSGTELQQEFVVLGDMTIGANVVYDDTPPTVYAVSNADDFEDICEDDNLRPGDIIELANGSYDTGGISIQDVDGTLLNPIIIRAANTGQAVLSGESYFNLRRAANIVIQGFHFTSNRYTVIKLEACNNIRITRNTFQLTEEEGQSGKWVYIGGVWDDQTLLSHHNRVDHNVFRDKHQLGNFITIDGGDNVSQHDRIDHNYFYNIGPRHDNEMEAIRVGWSQLSLTDGFTVIENNLFEDCDGDPEIISIKSCKDTVRYNTFRSSQGTVSLRHGDGTVVHDNYFLGEGKAGTGGVRIYARDHKIYNNYFEGLTGHTWDAAITLTNGDTDTGSLSAHWRINNVAITHNTLVNNFSNIEIGYGRSDNSWSRVPTNVTMANNLVVGGPADLVMVINEPSNFTWDSNIMYPTDGGEIGINLPFEQIQNVDPLLVYDATATDSLWFIGATSPAIDGGSNYLSLTRDVHGHLRSNGNDVGADEYSTQSVQRPPLRPENVGPFAEEIIVGIAANPQQPKSHSVLHVYPNPFNPSTTLSYELAEQAWVRLEIFNVRGQAVAVLHEGIQEGGSHQLRWDTEGMSTGLYIAVLTHGHHRVSQKLLLIR